MERRYPFTEPSGDLSSDIRRLHNLASGGREATNTDTSLKDESPDIGSLTTDFLEHWLNKDVAEYMAFEGLLCVLEQCLITNSYETFDAFITSLRSHALVFFEGVVTVILDSDVLYHTTHLETLLELLALRQFMQRSMGPILRQLLHASSALKSVYLNSSKKRAEERLRFFKEVSAVKEEVVNGTKKRVLEMKAHAILCDFHFPQQKTIVLQDDTFPVYTIENVRNVLSTLGYTLKSPEYTNDRLYGDFLRAALTGLPNGNLTTENWLNILRMNFRFSLQISRECRPDDIVWVQDLQFLFLGCMLDILAPTVKAVLYVECPFLANEEVSGDNQLADILRAMLGYRKIAFQTRRDCEAFKLKVSQLLTNCKVLHGYSGESYRIATDDGRVISVTYKAIGAWADAITDVTKIPIRPLDRHKPVFGFVHGFDCQYVFPRYARQIRSYFRDNPERVGVDVCVFIFIVPLAEHFKKLLTDLDDLKDSIQVAELHDSTAKEAAECLLKCDAIFHASVDFKADLLVKIAVRAEPAGLAVYAHSRTGFYQELSDCRMLLTRFLKEDFGNISELMSFKIREDPYAEDSEARDVEKCLPTESLLAWFCDITRFWNQSDLLCHKPLDSLDDFSGIMKQVRQLRIKIASNILRLEKIPANSIESFQNVADALESGMKENYARDFKDHMNEVMKKNVKDEVLTLKKDIRFLEMYTRKEPFDEFVKFLSEAEVSVPSELASPASFISQIDELAEWLRKLTETGIRCFITDWDGTMKTYATSYDTCMQPAYSAIIIAAFAHRFTELSAVLTAGPLRGTGILDLTCVPDDYLTGWGGSWGLEWSIAGKNSVNTDGICAEAMKKLAILADNLDARVFSLDKFRSFKLIGSGFQRKVDRIALGVQTVARDVDPSVSKDFIACCLDQVTALDPDYQYLAIHLTEFDLEIVIKQKDKTNSHFTKADGIDQCIKRMGVDMARGYVLICGDTASDIPMVERALHLNADRTFSIFVGADVSVKTKLEKMLPKDRLFFALCPEVVHCAMARCLMHPVVISEESV